MAINNNVTFRRKHRPVWYGMLCLVLITAAVSTMSLIPTQSNDLSSAESGGSYTLSGGDYDNKPYDSLWALVNDIHSSTGTEFTITVHSDDTDFYGFELDLDKKEVTLTSSSDGPFTLTVKTKDVRHFTVVTGTLILDKIILEGNRTVDSKGYCGGIEVGSSGILIMKDGAVIQNCIAINGGGVSSQGTFTMEGGIIKGNKTPYVDGDYSVGKGAGLYNEGMFTMNGGEISGNTSETYGGGVYNVGTFTMSCGEISGNTADWGGNGVYNESTFTMNNGTISGNTSNNGLGGGVYNNGSNAEFEMNGGEISGNTAIWGGGGVYNPDGTFTMTNGTISDNTIIRYFGGGVYNSRGTFTMTNGTISGNNNIEGEGGGVYSNGTFTMTNGTISGNNARWGAGGAHNNGIFTMIGGEISGNTTPVDGGGVINQDEFIMIGGVISGNTAGFGGGVRNVGEFTMIGGEISGNTAEFGGGIHNGYGMTVINGGEISGNTASGALEDSSGGGIYTADFTILKVGNGVVFSGNKAPMLRMFMIDNDDVLTYYDDNIGSVVLDEWAKAVQNAPAYNNFDINYPGDTWVVSIYIEPNGSGTVTVTENGNEPQILDKDGWVYLPAVAGSISLSADAAGGYEH